MQACLLGGSGRKHISNKPLLATAHSRATTASLGVVCIRTSQYLSPCGRQPLAADIQVKGFDHNFSQLSLVVSENAISPSGLKQARLSGLSPGAAELSWLDRLVLSG
jgi:hypothetical protein